MTRPKLIKGDVREVLKGLDPESVQCVVTSPPYWGLRDYGVDDQLGLEPTPEEYVENMVSVFQEVKRVLRKDGTVWLNLGDSYFGGGRGKDGKYEVAYKSVEDSKPDWSKVSGLKPKDLVGIPWRVALALQADGWWLRSDIIWNKPNPMPEAVTDRPTKSHEHIFLLTKSKKYYYDHEAIKEPYNESSIQRINQASFDQQTGGDKDYGKVSVYPGNTNSARKALEKFKENLGGGRNRRTVWEIVTKPYPGAHFATFPEEIPEICIKAGTSQAGCCVDCGSPYERVVEIKRPKPSHHYKKKGVYDTGIYKASKTGYLGTHGGKPDTKTLGWEPSCDCNADKVPCVVLDPFVGSGTTCAVASRLGRNSIGIELNEEYLKLARKRCKTDSESLLKYV